MSRAPTAEAALDPETLQRLDTGPELNLGVARTAQNLSRGRALELIALAASAAAAYLDGADLRFFNVAVKALGPSWWRGMHIGDSVVAGESSRVVSLITECGSRMRREAVVALRSSWPGPDEELEVTRTDVGDLGFHALTGGPSRTLALFLSGPGRRGWLRSSCEYLGTGVGSGPSMYHHAWTPPTQREPATAQPVRPATSVETWDAVAAWLEAVPASEPVLLFGMPVVPARVLASTAATIVNAHNGAIPEMRGLDALAWSIALGKPPTATAHEVVAKVDAGRIMAVARLSPMPLATVADRLKRAQCQVLAAALTTPLETPATGLPAMERYFGRMHPHLRRILDDVTHHHATPAAAEGTRYAT